MNKFLTIIFFLVFTSAHAGGHISKKQKQETDVRYLQVIQHNESERNKTLLDTNKGGKWLEDLLLS